MKNLSIGDTYQGGIIFYLDSSGCHGLISAQTDYEKELPWFNQKEETRFFNAAYVDTRAYGSGLFEGKYNTFSIISRQGWGAEYAASVCRNLESGGYEDWYLPSIEELNRMYQNIGGGNALGLGNIGLFSEHSYWSSTELDKDNAWSMDLIDGGQGGSSKSVIKSVRAVRAF